MTKTLDEVIAQYEYCLTLGFTACGDCKYRDTDGVCRMRENALHYLKEYRSEKAMWEADRKGYLDWIEQYKEAREKHQQAVIELKKNPPLTWDELKQMEGKPVWIDSVPLVRRWVIIKKFHPIGGNKNLFDMEVEDGAHFLRKNMRRDEGAWWQAYRKERE